MKLKEFIVEFDKHFQSFLLSKEEECEKIIGQRRVYVDHIKEVCLHGKRIRPYNAYTFFHGYSSQKADIMDFLLSFELLHTMALIHDDWIDHGMLRRSVPTCHVYYNTLINNKHLADSQAILVGDLCFGWAYEVLSTPIRGVDSAHHIQAQSYFHRMVQEVVLGQMLDVDMMRGLDCTIQDIEAKCYYKTASYTFVKPMLAGAALAGLTDQEELSKIKKLGESLGIAYQYRDDLKDMIEQHEDKDTFSDIQEGQQTIFSHYVQSHGSKEQVSFLQSKMGTILSAEDKQELNSIFDSVGAFDHGKQRISEMLLDAERLLKALKINQISYNAIYDIIQLLRT